ncbi:hypothetical protein [Streptomyces sp. IBSBF 2435]|uniref:hypothetical protein n=1 Tax=Streptomyces sp. IBSBF 2435 TaxID=2903531 RepID=UPI002FDBE096
MPGAAADTAAPTAQSARPASRTPLRPNRSPAGHHQAGEDDDVGVDDPDQRRRGRVQCARGEHRHGEIDRRDHPDDEDDAGAHERQQAALRVGADPAQRRLRETVRGALG